jgi:hypothetical protein
MCSASNVAYSSPNALSINSFKSRVWPLVSIIFPNKSKSTVTVTAVLSKRVISIKWLQKMGKKSVFGCFKMSSRNMPRRTEKNYRNSLSSVTASALREIQYVYRQVAVRNFRWKIWNHLHCCNQTFKPQITIYIVVYYFVLLYSITKIK